MPANFYRFFSLFFCLASTLFANHANAARPMTTDDARVVDPHSCQLDSWLKKTQTSNEYWLMPACNFSQDIEWGLGLARTLEDTQAQSMHFQAQAKIQLKPVTDYGIALSLGSVTHRQNGLTQHDWYATLPVSTSFLDERVFAHANLGWLREGSSSRNFKTWALGLEAQLTPNSWVSIESFAQSPGSLQHQIGMRYWLKPERIQIDVSYGWRNSGEARWFTLGVHFATPAFLH